MPRYRFKLVAGRHIDRSSGVRRTYVKGDIIETDQDLSVHNSHGSLKFLSMGEVPEGQPSKDTGLNDGESDLTDSAQVELDEVDNDDDNEIDVENLEQYSVAVLRKFADQMDIDLGTSNRKADIITAIKAAIE